MQCVFRAPAIKRELQRCGMQEQPLQTDLFAQPLIDFGVAVLIVAGNRMADMLRVHADLVGAPGLDPHFAIRMPAATLQNAEMTQRRLALRVNLDMALSSLTQADMQRRVDRHHAIGHASGQ